MKSENKKHVLEMLEKLGFLEYGKIIPREVIEIVLDIKFEESWEFLGPFLELKQLIEENGYLSTSENMTPGNLRIFGIDEISHRSNLIFKNMLKKMKHLETCLTRTKVVEFDHNEYMKHLHITNKVSCRVNSLINSCKY